MSGYKNIKEYYPNLLDFQKLLEQAARSAVSVWEIDFVSNIEENYEKYGQSMKLSNKQHDQLIRIAGW